MKTLMAGLLAALMLLSSTAALADTQKSNDTNAAIYYNDAVTSNYDSDGNESERTSSAVDTELWLQVYWDFEKEYNPDDPTTPKSAAQIDVTVPLVLVFATDVNGGTAAAPTAYGITNNGKTGVVVKNMAVTTKDTTKMTLAAYPASSTTMAKDNYAVKFTVGSGFCNTTADFTADANAIASTAATATVEDGGLFKVYGKNDATTAQERSNVTPITVDMTTGPLSFVTAYGENDTLDTTKGVKLLQVTYTVAVDTSDASTYVSGYAGTTATSGTVGVITTTTENWKAETTE